MTKREFLHQYMLNRACASTGDPSSDLRLALQAVESLEGGGFGFDEVLPAKP